MFARIYSAQPAIPKAHVVRVETDVSRGLHAFSIVGLPDKAVEEARDRVSAAIKNTGFTAPKSTNKKITVSLAPASVKKEGSIFDLPVALSYLLSVEDVSFNPEEKLFAGELSLDGSLAPISGVLPIALAAREGGFRELFVPAENAEEAALVPGITVYGAESLGQVIAHLLSEAPLRPTPHALPEIVEPEYAVALEDIRGQESAKRALEIAAAGRHNIALYGPPGTGKTMLARALATLLPPLSESELIEVTTIHSVAGALQQAIMRHAPIRSPHHTASYASLIGGGAVPKPGEVTLAHRGVLFCDEFPEFKRDVINALRQPLEDGEVSVTRVRGAQRFPARFILVAALNPCPCGYYGSTRCTCMPLAIERYRRKISGPIADRIDMWIPVGEIPLATLHTKHAKKGSAETNAARTRIALARAAQEKRFAESDTCSNAEMTARTISEKSQVSPEAEKTLAGAAEQLKLSPRGYHRTIKLSRTIADLAGSATVETPHMLEALQYRQREW